MTKILPQHFYSRSALEVAPELLGKILSRRWQGETLSGRIVEVEAYLGRDDPASHAYRGKTPRNEVMFGPAGVSYVYFTYGMHFCMNVVTGKVGEAGAVLIRALEPLSGIETMKRFRKKTSLYDLTSGPGKLTQALHIRRSENNARLLEEPLWISSDGFQVSRWIQTPRIGIRVATRKPYRFILESIHLSRRNS